MSSPTYANFDLLIDLNPVGVGYRARVLQSPAGEATVDFVLPFSNGTLAYLPGWTDMDGHHPGAMPDGADAVQDPLAIGTLLYAAVFTGPVGVCLRRSLDEVERRGSGLRIRLRLDQTVLGLAGLPWELLYAPDLGRFLALSDLTPLVRYIELDRPVRPLQARLPLTILAVISNPTDMQPLAVEGEWRNLQDALSPLVERGVIALERLEAATLSALQARLRRGPVDLMHFIGHGFFDAQGATGALVFEDGQGRPEVVTAEMLGTLLHDHEALRLVFLNACQSAQGEPSTPFAGVAQRLVQQGLPAVLAMQFPVSDTAAIALSQAFYQALAEGLPVDSALSEARKAVAACNSDGDWATAVLFSRSDDNRLFDLLDVLPLPACPYPGMVPFRAEDQRFFHGRADEIEQMLRQLRHQRLLLVVGPSGSGKSSLISAGVLPKLADASDFPPGYWLVRTVRPGDHPLQTMTAAIPGDFSQPAEAVAALLAANKPAQRLLLVVDQFEEIFSLAGPEERQGFIALFNVLRRTKPCVILAAMRADFYPDLMDSDLWPVDASQRLEITALRGEALRRAIRQPASQVEVEIDDALVERLMADAAGEPGVLPMLQETLVLLWVRTKRRRISLEQYAQLGDGQRSGLAVAIAIKADATLADLTPDEQRVARRIFLRLVQFGQGRADTRRQLPETELRSASDDQAVFAQVLRHLAENRLLTLSGGEGGVARLVDISHERLIGEWPRFLVWMTQQKEAEQTRRLSETKAQEWVRLGRAEGGLLDQTELTEVGAWLDDPIAQELGYSPDLVDLVKASRKAIKPGWDPWGAVGLVVSSVTAVVLMALVYTWLHDSRTPGTARLPFLLFYIALAGLVVIALLLLRRSDRYVLQRLSERIARKRRVLVGIGLFAIAAVVLWSGYLVRIYTQDQLCQDLGLEKDTLARTVALIDESDEPIGSDVYRLVLQRVSSGWVRAYAVSESKAWSCKGYFSHLVRLKKIRSPGEIVYVADIRKSRSGEQVKELREFDNEEKCSVYGLLAARSANELGYPGEVGEEWRKGMPNDCETYLLNEECYVALSEGRYEIAEQKCLRAIERFPGYVNAHANLGIIYYLIGRNIDSVAALRRAVDLSGDQSRPAVLMYLARSCQRAGKFACAEESGLRAVAADPDDWKAHALLADVYRTMGDYQNSLRYLDDLQRLITAIDDVRQVDAAQASLDKQRGILAFLEGDAVESTRLLSQAEAGLGVEDEEVVYFLALSYQQQDKTPSACRYWRRYIQIPNSNGFAEAERREDARKQMNSLGCP